jgi:hypothetical protein
VTHLAPTGELWSVHGAYPQASDLTQWAPDTEPWVETFGPYTDGGTGYAVYYSRPGDVDAGLVHGVGFIGAEDVCS